MCIRRKTIYVTAQILKEDEHINLLCWNKWIYGSLLAVVKYFVNIHDEVAGIVRIERKTCLITFLKDERELWTKRHHRACFAVFVSNRFIHHEQNLTDENIQTFRWACDCYPKTDLKTEIDRIAHHTTNLIVNNWMAYGVTNSNEILCEFYLFWNINIILF